MGARELPFKVGQHAESRSFAVGFRGAWFRCEVTFPSSYFVGFFGLASYICYLYD